MTVLTERMVNQDMVWKPRKIFYLFVHVYANLRMVKTVKWANSKLGRGGGGYIERKERERFRGIRGHAYFTENVLYSVWSFWEAISRNLKKRFEEKLQG